MVLSYYLLKIPYSIVWYLKKLIGNQIPLAFYCAELIDWEVIKPIQSHLPDLPIITNNNVLLKYLKAQGKTVYRLPSFPAAVIMSRHACHKFPVKKMKKIGMRHGAYHFKSFANPDNYNLFDLYLFTSESEVKEAKAIGVKNAVAVGFPKLDPAFDGSLDMTSLSDLKKSLDPKKQIILFTATYPQSGMSAISEWYDKLEDLRNNFNILVTIHPFCPQSYQNKIKSYSFVKFITNTPTLPYLVLADCVIGDNSSILAEACALNKAIVTFKTDSAKRKVSEIDTMLDEISVRINNFSELKKAIDYAIKNNDKLTELKQQYNIKMFDVLDGKAGLRAAKLIKQILKN